MLLKEKAIEIAAKVLEGDEKAEFTAPNGWLCKLIERNGYTRANLHGEGGEIDEQEAEKKMQPFRAQLQTLCEQHNIPPYV